MSNAELKNSLIEKINSIDNPIVLQNILSTVILEKELNSKKIHQLDPEFEKELDEIITQVKSGIYLTHEEANNEIKKWLEE